MKACTNCGEEKSEEEFHWKVKGERRMPRCKVCQCEYFRKYKEKNREKVLECVRKSSRKYREKNPEHYKKYRASNPHITPTGRAVKVSPLTPQELFCGLPRSQVNAEVRFDYILRDLLTEKTGVQHHVDHIKPLCEGGVHRMWNLAVISADANLKKGPVWFLEDHLTDADIDAQDAEIRAISQSLPLGTPYV